ncbi:uncharacterized protein LOC114673819 isoform X2 [Macaca mulatta]|uniref:uncharacterized protein LOC114673819 isoform X2 n=1 Tax=Macaca mulatta TaxID=9544 RepID=UPI0010A25194|nr:uncharacterized protein LOC114673819 isoform X2 [Macaca mulatta]XP_045233871.1 uncharacterized protein LOC102125450 isoform X4 [Macaca fascicularis]
MTGAGGGRRGAGAAGQALPVLLRPFPPRPRPSSWQPSNKRPPAPPRGGQKRSNPAMLPEDTASPTFTRRWCSAQVGSVRFPRFRPESESASKSHASQNVRKGRRSVGAAACPCS